MEKMVERQVLIGATAPDFKAETTEGPLSFYEWLGNSWCILFSHPAAYTPVCTTELGAFAYRKSEFDEKGVKLLCLNTSSLSDCKAWMKDIKEITGASVNYPLVCDQSLEIANLYGMIHPGSSETATVRTVFFIDPNKQVRALLAYPATTGRSIDEILRVIDSLQMRDSKSLATPVDWMLGDDCIIPSKLNDPQTLNKMFPKGWTEKNPWYRTTPNP
jgi:alkyl hydroperoxide reductase subunit AhpC